MVELVSQVDVEILRMIYNSNQLLLLVDVPGPPTDR